MADSAVEIVIRARDEASAALNQAARALASLQAGSSKAATSAAPEFGRIVGAITPIAPQLAQATAQVEALGSALSEITATGAAGALAGVGVAVAGIAVGGLLAARSFSETVEKLDNLSRATGSATGDLQVLQEAFRRAGLGADAANNAMIYLNRAIAEGNPLLKELGITARDPVNALLQLSRAFAASTDEAAKTKIATELMGRGGKDVLAVISNLAAEFPTLRTEMQKTGQLFSTDMVESGRKFDAEWDRFTGRWEGFMARIGGAAAKAANAVIDEFSKTDPVSVLTRSLERAQAELDKFRERVAAHPQEAALFPVHHLEDLENKVKQLTKQIEIAKAVAQGFNIPVPADLPTKIDGIAKAAGLLGADAPEVKKLMDSLGIGAQQAAALVREMKGASEVPGILEKIAIAEGGISDAGVLPIETVRRLRSEGIQTLQQLADHAGVTHVAFSNLIGPEVPKQIEEMLTKIRDATAAARGELTKERQAAGEFIGPPQPVSNARSIKETVTAQQKAAEELQATLSGFADSSTLSARLIGDAFQTVSASIQGFFEGALTDIHKVAPAVVATVRSMVAGILAELVKLELAKFFGFLLDVATGGLGTLFGPEIAAGAFDFSARPAVGIAGLAPSRQSDRTAASIDRLVAQLGISQRDTVRIQRQSYEDFVGSPFGAARAAERRLVLSRPI